MSDDKKVKLIKSLLSYLIEKNRQEEKFMESMNEIKSLFNIDINPIQNLSFYELADKYGIKNEEKTEEIYEFFNRKDVSVNELVEEFCEKYDI